MHHMCDHVVTRTLNAGRPGKMLPGAMERLGKMPIDFVCSCRGLTVRTDQ